jgi:undecaprenyl-diphosphatase
MLFYPRLWAPLGVLGLAIGYSRVYCGVHYPADVLVGFLVGLVAALAVQLPYRAWLRHRTRRRTAVATSPPA